jgi:hypothetical protein
LRQGVFSAREFRFLDRAGRSPQWGQAEEPGVAFEG